MNRFLIPSIIAALSAPAFSQLNDVSPVDLKQVLTGLRQFKEQNETGLKARLNAAYKQIVTASASNEAAAAFWTNAVTAVQFNGVDRQSAAIRDWAKGEGEALKVKEGANAARLSLVWLGLTIQHANDAETSKLLPSIIDFTKQLEADEVAIGHLAERVKRTLDHSPALKNVADTNLYDSKKLNDLENHLARMVAGKPVPGGKEALEDVRAKIFHDRTLRTPVSGTVVVQNLQIAELIGESGKKKKKGDDTGPASWEPVPANRASIYEAIILPEFREEKDPRVMDYWDMMLRKSQESLYAGIPAFKEKEITQIEKPKLMWARAQDMLILGLKNRAITEMFNLIKAYPQHPEAANWIGQLEQMLQPSISAPGATIQGSGTVAPPSAVPPATSPGNPPTAIIVPSTPAGAR